jgi:hypothetical protein
MLVSRQRGLWTLFTEVGNKEITEIVFYEGKNEVKAKNSDIDILEVEADRKIKEPMIRTGNYVFNGILYIQAKNINVKVTSDAANPNAFSVSTTTTYLIETVKPFIKGKTVEKETKVSLNRLSVNKTDRGLKAEKFAEDFNIPVYNAEKIIDAYNLF